MSDQGELVALNGDPIAPPHIPTPAELLALAIQKSESGAELVEVVERLAALMERENERQAKREFSAAMANFQANCPQIPKKRSQGGVSTAGSKRNVKYAALQDIDDVIRDHLKKNGLSYSLSCVNDSENGKSWMMYRVTVRHKGGHEETCDGPKIPYDAKLAANDSQKGGSTSNYAIRYALAPALGLIFQGDDTDGNPPDPSANEKITEQQRLVLERLITETTSDLEAFCNHMKVDILDNITKGQYSAAVEALERKKRKMEASAREQQNDSL